MCMKNNQNDDLLTIKADVETKKRLNEVRYANGNLLKIDSTLYTSANKIKWMFV